MVPLLSLTGIAFIDPTEFFTPQPLMDWGLVTEPILGAANRRIHYAQGKTLGGSSAINTMSYLRGSRSSYQRIADIVGDDSWTFDNLLKYFKKSAQLTPPNLDKRNSTNATVFYDESAFDPCGGPLQVSWNNWVDPTITWLAQTIQQAGLPLSPEGFSSGNLVGSSSWVPSTIDPQNAHRSSAKSSYLKEAIDEGRGLTVYTHTQATKILFDDSSAQLKATGVRVNTQGVEYTLSAAREVVVSAGAFHSPQLLMVSGIGPKATLESLDIPGLVDSPNVGQNLLDPISVGVSYPVNTPSAGTLTANPELAPGYVQQYLEDASGPFSSAAGFLATERVSNSTRAGFSVETRQKLSAYPDDWPELIYVAGSYLGENLTTAGSIAAWMPISFSRGNVTITSASVSDPPSIHLNWLSDAADTEIAVAAVRRLRGFWATDAANAIKTGDELRPGSAVETDEEILDSIRGTTNQIWHPVGTCAMGKSVSDAVVDSQGRVFGALGLRVVDASILPITIPANPQGTLYAMAEKIADDVKNSVEV